MAKNLSSSQTTLPYAVDKFHEVSLRLSYRIGRAAEAHTIGEKLVKPCLIEAARNLFNQRQVDNFQIIPLSDNTVNRRIRDISSWLEEKVCSEIKLSPSWALQLDESTDVSGSAILLVLVRYVSESRVHEELLICKPLLSNATGEAIFELVEHFASTYPCERGFSVYIATKNKYRNRLDAEPDMRLQLSGNTPNFAEILSGCQIHPSH
ncbi:zinc finger BED domain-containing protein 5-like [Galendromus occidentalis]|uniref:Zinc finger BED domain-containing protein 5-like n=1 Tax=Galendromus occidentalis TaxID=34638 RepID=A0AAJ6VWX6_9ACAR|nr:zinc finger BED domain-containing protein 5-like [Galendromus occidentalis]